MTTFYHPLAQYESFRVKACDLWRRLYKRQEGGHVYVRTFDSKRHMYNVPETKTAEFANSVDLDEVAHHEPPQLGLHCFPSSL